MLSQLFNLATRRSSSFFLRGSVRAFASTPVETPKPEPENPARLQSNKTHKVDKLERKVSDKLDECLRKSKFC